MPASPLFLTAENKELLLRCIDVTTDALGHALGDTYDVTLTALSSLRRDLERVGAARSVKKADNMLVDVATHDKLLYCGPGSVVNVAYQRPYGALHVYIDDTALITCEAIDGDGNVLDSDAIDGDDMVEPEKEKERAETS